jgi:hypothetical protein
MPNRGEIVERFDYERWRAEFVPQPQQIERARLQVTDIFVTPDSTYSFEVRAGLGVSFLFADLPHVSQALKDMVCVLPN